MEKSLGKEELYKEATILTCGQEKTYLTEISRAVLITAHQFLVKGNKSLCTADSFVLSEKDLWAKKLWNKSKVKLLALEIQ